MRPDGIEAPIGPVLGAPRRSRDRARIAVVAAIAVVVLAAGIGLAGNGFTNPPSSPSASTSPSVGPTAGATPTASPLPPPTPNIGLGCAPVRLGSPPEITLSPAPGDPLAKRGSRATPADGTGASPPAWPIVPIENALYTGASASIELRSEQDACMRYIIADYMPGEPEVSVPFPISFRTLNVSPPRSIMPLGPLPRGDWIVRVVAYFSTGTAGQEDGTVMERFFRVINSDTAGPLPTPATPPAVPCAGPPAGGVPPTLVLSGSGDGLVEGTPGLGAPLIVPPVAPVRLGDSIEIRVTGDACAIAWTIDATQPDVNSNRYDIEREPNAGNDPFLFAQNRWRLHDLPTGNLFVTATIRFSVDVLVTSRWLLDVQGGPVPVARIVAPDGTTVAALRSDCRAVWVFEEGTGGYEVCATEPIPSGLTTLRVAPETPLRIEVPGWKITNWGGSCGRSDETNNPAQPFLIVDGCDLGGRYLPEGSSAQEPAVFLPRSTGPLVSLYLTVQRDGATVGFSVWAMVETTS
jgi:hypothetical protein